jgi:hypothetical protein
VVLDSGAVHALGVTRAQLDAAIAHERAELARRRQLYPARHAGGEPRQPERGRGGRRHRDGGQRGGRGPGPAGARCATDRRRFAGQHTWRGRGAGIPCRRVHVACLARGFGSVGGWYQEFAQTSNAEVAELLEAGRRELPATLGARVADLEPVVDPEVSIPVRDDVRLDGSLSLPAEPRGLVVSCTEADRAAGARATSRSPGT